MQAIAVVQRPSMLNIGEKDPTPKYAKEGHWPLSGFRGGDTEAVLGRPRTRISGVINLEVSRPNTRRPRTQKAEACSCQS